MNRRSLVLAGLAALPAVAVLAPVSAKPKRTARQQRGPAKRAAAKPARRQRSGGLTASHARFRVVTRTFNRPGLITIPDEGAATPYPSILQVGGFRQGKIQDVNVRLNGVSHTLPKEIRAILVAPNGRTAVVLMSDVGGDDDITNVNLVFDDQAVGFLPFDAQIVSGSFKPTQPGVAPSPDAATLRAFNGLNPNGGWRLYLADNVGGDEGSVASWALTIRARVSVPHQHGQRANKRQRRAKR